MASLQLEKVSKYFYHPRKRAVLRNCSTMFSQNTITTITGPSGSGKSTLLYCLAGFEPIDSGAIVYGDEDVTEICSAQRASLWTYYIGVVLQYPYLISELTIYDNIALKGYIAGLSRTDINSHVMTLLTDIALVDYADAYPDELSGGQQQRVALARALCNMPAFVLADEPTAHLDAENTDMLMRLLTHYRDRFGCGIIVASHDERVVHNSDSIYTIPKLLE